MASDLILQLGDANLAWNEFRDEGMRIEILGQSGAGKSHAVKVIMEEYLRNKIPFVVIDPEGEYASFREITPVIVLGGKFQDLPLESVLIEKSLSLLYSNDFSIVFDLSELIGIEERSKAATEIQHALFHMAGEYRKLFLYVVDEAKLIAPQQGKSKAKAVASDIAQRGRKRGIIPVFSMQRPSEVDKGVITQCNVHFFGKLHFPTDLAYIKDLLRDAEIEQDEVKQLSQEFYLWTGGKAERVKFRSIKIRDLGRTVQPGEHTRIRFKRSGDVQKAVKKLGEYWKVEKKKEIAEKNKVEVLETQLEQSQEVILVLQEELEREREAARIATKLQFEVSNSGTEVSSQVMDLQSRISALEEQLSLFREFQTLSPEEKGRFLLELKEAEQVEPVNIMAIDIQTGNVIGDEASSRLLNNLTAQDRYLYFAMRGKGPLSRSKLFSLIPGKGKIKLTPSLTKLVEEGLVNVLSRGRFVYFEAIDLS